MTYSFDRGAWLEQLQKTEAEQRVAISDMIDRVYLAYRDAGGSDEDYLSSQFFQNLLFQAAATTKANSSARTGALQCVLVFMRRLEQHYIDMKQDEEWQREHRLRKA